MKKNNLRLLIGIISAALLLFPVLLIANQLPSGKTDRTFAKWEWRNATLQSVASHISTVSGIDIVVDSNIDTVKINISLRDRTWQDVLSIICNTKGWKYQVLDDGTIYVVDERYLNDRLVSAAQMVTNLEQRETLEIFTVKLKNTIATEMQSSVTGVLSFPQREKVVPVQHTNSLTIHCLAKNVDRVKEFIEEMDTEVLQISISAKIVEVSSGSTNGIGIQWSFFDGKGSEVTHLPTAQKGSGIIDQAFERATYGVLDPNGFSIALEYLFTNTNSEIVAEPQVTTLENKMATIYMGSKIPLNYLDLAGNTKTEQIDARTELRVVPTVTGQGKIKMDLQPVKRSYEMSSQGPIVHEQGAQTNVVVQDGETIVIGGLTNDEIKESESGIPFLKDIPILGFLFKKRSGSNDKRDLVIFVTPHIIKTTKLDLYIDENATQDSTNIEISVEPQEISAVDVSTAEVVEELQ